MDTGLTGINSVKTSTGDELFKEFITRSRDLFYKYNLDTERFEYISDTVEQLTGYKAENYINEWKNSVLPTVHPDDQPKLMEIYNGLKANLLKSMDITLEYRLRHKNGHYISVSDNLFGVHDESGRVVSIIGTLRDITPLKALEKYLENTDESRKLLGQNLPCAYFRTRLSDGKLLDCNETLWKRLNFASREECLEKCYLSNYYPKEARASLLKILEKDGQLNKVEVQAKVNGEDPIWIETTAKVFSELGYIEGVFHEITLRKALTSAEVRVLKMVLEGKGNMEIAEALHRSKRTIEDHRSHIMWKLNVHNIAELLLKASQIAL
jgi:PAS domain S-box-containing protein